MRRSNFLASTALGLTFVAVFPAVAQDIIDIPAQPLAAALTELANETGLQVTTTQAAIAGKMSRAVSGPMTPQAALRAMLYDTGLNIRIPEQNGAVLSFGNIVSQNATSEEEPVDLGTLVLRGELLERDLQDSQSSVLVATGEDVEQRGETSVGQILRRTPGVSQPGRLVIRGIADDGGLGNLTSSSTINVTTDGIRLSDYRNVGVTAISTWDVEQVEVFRGSQSTNQGRNALAGAIVVEGVKPAFVPEYKLRLGLLHDEGAGNGDEFQTQTAFVLNTPLVEDQLAFRLTGDLRGTNGLSDITNRTIRAGLLYEPLDQLSIGLTYTDIDRGRDTPTLIESPRLTVDYDISDNLTFSSRTQYTDAQTGVDLGIFGRARDYETIDQEFQLKHETDRIRAIVGYFYTDIDEVSTLFSNQPLGLAPGLTIEGVETQRLKTENQAIYGELEYDLTPEWTLVAGLRYDVENVDNSVTIDATLTSPAGSSPLTGLGELDTTYEALLPKLGVIYHFNEEQSLGLTYQRGYRAGGVGVAVPFTGGPAFSFVFDPEFTDTFELSYRSQSSDGTRTLNANVYYTTWTDQQVNSSSALGTFVSNAANSKLWGAEVDYRQLFNNNFEVFGTLALSKTEFGNVVGLNGVRLDGNSFPSAPEVQASLGASYQFDNGLIIGGDVNYTSSTFSDSTNLPAFKNDAYWVTNLNASYEFGNGISLNAYARNLFDEDYTTSKSTTGFIAEGPQREVGVFLTAEF
ncbi:MAG: TonB-dependent receptor [Pseudomonadota bacterium]